MESVFLFARKTALIALFLFVGISCDSNSGSDIELDVISLNSVTIDDITITLFSDNSLETGSNDLYWTVKKNNAKVAVKSFSITPIMDMHTMQHSTPYTEPAASEIDDSYFHSMVTFIMPSGEMGSWEIGFEIETQTGEIISGSLPVQINSSWKLTSVRNNNDVYFISWLTPEKPVSGKNDLQFMIYTRETMMSFPPVSDAELIIYPYMDMGGGSGHSTDFTNPVSMGGGLYNGDINYSMSGIWTTSVQLVTAQNDSLDEVVFEYSVQAK